MKSPKRDVFFRDPQDPPTQIRPVQFSTLYILRRDANTCLQPKTGSGAAFPGVMTLLTGIDLLAKFYAGNDARREVGKRFRTFVWRYFRSIPKEKAGVLYRLRNELHHSFRLGNGLMLTDDKGAALLTPLGSRRYLIGVHALHQAFEVAISAYREDLESNPIVRGRDLRVGFRKMFRKYGAIWIR